MPQRNRRLEELGQELAKQKEIVDKYAPIVQDPSDSLGYKAAKKKFDAAYKRMGEIEREIERLQKPRPGAQTQPSQSKVKL